MNLIITASLPSFRHEAFCTPNGHASVSLVETNMRGANSKRVIHYSIILNRFDGSVAERRGYVAKHFTDACSYARLKAKKL